MGGQNQYKRRLHLELAAGASNQGGEKERLEFPGRAAAVGAAGHTKAWTGSVGARNTHVTKTASIYSNISKKAAINFAKKIHVIMVVIETPRGILMRTNGKEMGATLPPNG